MVKVHKGFPGVEKHQKKKKKMPKEAIWSKSAISRLQMSAAVGLGILWRRKSRALSVPPDMVTRATI